MSLAQALLYFLREALVSLARSWRASSVAILTITMSLFIGGLFLLATGNLARQVQDWSEALKVIVYLEANASEEQISDLAQRMSAPGWVRRVDRVSAEEARSRFAESFPSLGDVVSDDEDSPFPASLEAVLAEGKIEIEELGSWVAELRDHPAAEVVDDDRDWLLRLSRLLTLVRAGGLALGFGLLVAASFTIASVVRLTAYLYVEEIAVMRLVGATEFFIRGPFYVEGLLQGLAGGALSLALLYGASRLALLESADSVWLPLVLGGFLDWETMVIVVLVGGAAGLIGAIFSLRRETLRVDSSD